MFKKILNNFRRFYYKLRLAIEDRGANKDLIIIPSDGGICSQINFWVLGLFYEECGFRVKYDLSWFQKDGMDMNKKFVRNYDLERAFPEVILPVASDYECFSFIKHHLVEGVGQRFRDIVPPAYITHVALAMGSPQLVIQYRHLLRRHFNITTKQLSPSNIKVLNFIQDCEHACAVHIRRGDLSGFIDGYGEPVDVKYFNEAIQTILGENKNAHFFFFSDEIPWVQSNVIPSIKDKATYTIVTGNGSDKGYIDLFLMSKCDSFITSQGSLGKFARILRSDNAVIIEPSSKSMFDKELSENALVF